MKIAYLIPEFPGQTHIFFWREIQVLRNLGVEVDIVSTRKPPTEIVCHEWSEKAILQTQYLVPMHTRALLGASWIMLKAGPARWLRCVKVIWQSKQASIRMRLQMLMLIPVAGRLIQLARKKGWKHCHAHSCAMSALLLLYVRLLADLPYSLTLHGPLSIYGPAQKDKWSHADFGITVTEQLRNEVISALPELCGGNVCVAPMGVDFKVFKRASKYAPPAHPGPFRIVSCGRLHFGKGHQDLIRAIAELRESNMDVYLTIMGEGGERRALEGLIHKLGLDGKVVLTGAVPENTVRDELERAHLFALGSHDEAIGVATMEAMAMRLPVVVTDVGGVRELVRDGVDGLLVKPGAPGQMAEAIQCLLRDAKRCCRLGESGSKRVAERFGCERSAKLMFERFKRRAKASFEYEATPKTT